MPQPISPAQPGDHLVDPQGRRLDYLRFSVTDRCNLRCRYCMPEKGVDLVPRQDLLSFEEAFRLCRLLCAAGIKKIRITGGEPLVRRGTIPFLARLAELPSRPEVLLTTNGLLLEENLPQLIAAGIKRLNLSLDSLDPDNFQAITRRPGLDRVKSAMGAVLAAELGLKINVVVMKGVNDHELADFVQLTREQNLVVRFIETMRFDGSGLPPRGHLSGREILARLQGTFPLKEIKSDVADVARRFTIDGHQGRIGIITGHERTFCGQCTRLRLDARGHLRTCLYSAPRISLGDLIRGGADDRTLLTAVRDEVGRRLPDGFQAEKTNPRNGLISMASIGG